MLHHRNNMHEAGLRSSFVDGKFCEPDEFVVKERPDEDAAIQKRPGVPAHCFQSHPVVGEALPLANRCLVVDLPHPFDHPIVERYLSYNHAFFLRLLGFIPSLNPSTLVHQ